MVSSCYIVTMFHFTWNLCLFFFLFGVVESNVVKPSCSQREEICEFDLTLVSITTMINYLDRPHGTAVPVVSFSDGSFRERNRYTCEIENNTLLLNAVKRLVTGDGSYKASLLFNATLPGPPIVVYEGQQVVVRVKNLLLDEGTTVHWHGVHQRNTPWMDGAAGVSQCPINPGETFTYRFLADPVGTHWYHSHYGTQRTMGAYGPLIVLEKSSDEADKRRGDDPLPDFADEFYMIVSDFMRESSESILDKVKREAVSFSWPNGFQADGDSCFTSTKQADGVDCGVTPFISAVINGKGRHYDRVTGEAELPGLPLETFRVKRGRKYRFRVICSSMTFGFRLSIDGHPLNIIASDGGNVRTRQVESVILFSGERFDFWIDAKDPKNSGNYWIRAETLESYLNGALITPGHVEAILAYENSPVEEPQTKKRQCTAKSPCEVLNCPFRYFPDDYYMICSHITDLNRTAFIYDEMPTLTPKKQDNFVQHFLNFHFAKEGNSWKSTVNGKLHVPHASPPQLFPSTERQSMVSCNQNQCLDKSCRCTHVVEIPLGSVVQFVLAITITNPQNVLNGNSHQIHLHGTSYQVVKYGWPTYNQTTKFYSQRNPDIKCKPGSQYCNEVEWADPSWNTGELPGMITTGAPLKDTIVLPVGGYAVIRFKAENPGYWYMHCHTEFHNAEGMGLILKVGEPSQMNRPPAGMHTCGNFNWTDKEFRDRVDKPTSPVGFIDEPATCADTFVYKTASISLGAVCVFLLFFNFFIFCKFRPMKGYTLISGQ